MHICTSPPHTFDAADANLARCLSDLKVGGTGSKFVVVRSHDGGELSEGKFGSLRGDKSIKQAFTIDSPG